MRQIEYQDIVTTVQQLCIECCYELPADVFAAIEHAAGHGCPDQREWVVAEALEGLGRDDQALRIDAVAATTAIFPTSGRGSRDAERPAGKWMKIINIMKMVLTKACQLINANIHFLVPQKSRQMCLFRSMAIILV